MSPVALGKSNAPSEVPRVLIVGDEQITVRLIQLNLSRMGYIVSTGATAAQVLEKIKEDCPNLLIADINLPEQTEAFTLLVDVLHNAITKDIPVVVLLRSWLAWLEALQAVPETLKALQSRDTHWLLKPFDPKSELQYIAHRFLEIAANPQSP